MSNHMRVSSRAIVGIRDMPDHTTVVTINMSRVAFEELCVQQGWTLHYESRCAGYWGTYNNQMARYNYSFRTATFYSR